MVKKKKKSFNIWENILIAIIILGVILGSINGIMMSKSQIKFEQKCLDTKGTLVSEDSTYCICKDGTKYNNVLTPALFEVERQNQLTSTTITDDWKGCMGD